MPEWKEEITRRLRSLKLAQAREAEIVEEVAQHLEDRFRELVSGGAKEDDASRLALEEIREENLLAEGPASSEDRAARGATPPGGGSGMLAVLGQDLRYGLRVLGKKPGFTGLAARTAPPPPPAFPAGAHTAPPLTPDALLLIGVSNGRICQSDNLSLDT